MIRDVAEEVEYLPGRYKALSSNSSAAEKKTQDQMTPLLNSTKF
jgi:hypothetical protein